MSDNSASYRARGGQCGLCGFNFVGGDAVVTYVDGRYFSKEVRFREALTLPGKLLAPVFCHPPPPRVPVSQRNLPRGVTLHSQCYAWCPPSAITKLLDITECRFSPSFSAERDRARYLQEYLAGKLQHPQNWPQELPYEVWLMIAGYLIREIAITTALGRASGAAKPSDQLSHDTAAPAYAAFVKIDGQSYVRRIWPWGKGWKSQASNPLPSFMQNPPGPSKIILQLPQLHRKKHVFVASDATGVRRVFLVEPSQSKAWCRNHPVVPGAWWHLQTRLTAKSLQDQSLQPTDPPGSFVDWQVPMARPPSVIEINTLWPRPMVYPGALRMRFFECNSSDIVGYSVAFDPKGVPLTIFSHKRGQRPDRQMLPTVPSLESITGPGKLQLIFKPLNQGEYITEMHGLRVHDYSPRPELIGIMFTTNKGRTIVFGPNQQQVNTFSRRLVTLPPKPCRVFINELEAKEDLTDLKFIAFEGDRNHPFPASRGTEPSRPKPRPTLPTNIFGSWRRQYWYSSCSMRGASKIYPCIDGAVGSGSYETLIGLLVEFDDGRRESVGGIRLDWLAEPIVLDKEDKLCFHGPPTRLSLEVDVAFAPKSANKLEGEKLEGENPEDEKLEDEKLADEKLEVSQTDTLEWCFSIEWYRRNFLFNGRDWLG